MIFHTGLSSFSQQQKKQIEKKKIMNYLSGNGLFGAAVIFIEVCIFIEKLFWLKKIIRYVLAKFETSYLFM